MRLEFQNRAPSALRRTMHRLLARPSATKLRGRVLVGEDDILICGQIKTPMQAEKPIEETKVKEKMGGSFIRDPIINGTIIVVYITLSLFDFSIGTRLAKIGGMSFLIAATILFTGILFDRISMKDNESATNSSI